ncbi:MAG: glycosyltransferase family 2 protein [Planctomycetes bacterium]|nr:glycosyltransferase family 2 protein [Planctomycetota bacterium]
MTAPSAAAPALRITACIITRDEEDRIGDCLASLAGVADEVVVVDSGSTDRTRAIAAERGARVIEHAWSGHVQQKNHAVAQAASDWVLCLDADERLGAELARAIGRVKAAGPGAVRGFFVNRHTRYLGRWIRHGGWYPQWRLRLFDRRAGRWTGTDPHDRVEVAGPTARLDGDLLHDTYRSVSDHLRTIDSFTTIAARERRRAGRRFHVAMMLAGPVWRFVRMYVLRAGFLDGLPGLVLALMAGYYVFLKHLKLFELERAGGDADGA